MVWYTPTHRVIGDNKWYYILYYGNLFYLLWKSRGFSLKISYVIITIGIMIFLEMILLHFCNLDNNTNDNINNRIQNEQTHSKNVTVELLTNGEIDSDDDEIEDEAKEV